MLRLCDLMKTDGYIGGSTIDQLPVESSIEDRVAAFKAVASLRKKARETERTSRNLERLLRLATQSPQIRNQYASLARAARGSYDLFVSGDAGTGKTTVCEIIHQLSARRRTKIREGNRRCSRRNCSRHRIVWRGAWR